MNKFILAAAVLVPVAVAAPAANPQTGLIGVTRAVGIAEKAIAGRAIDAELETSGSGLIYEVELVRGSTLHEVHVDARSGTVVAAGKLRLESWWREWFDADRMKRAGDGASLSSRLAALERETGGTVQDVEFESAAGHAWYEVEVSTAAGVADVRLDAVTGQRLASVYDD